MKNNEKLPAIIWGMGLFMTFSTVVVVLYIVLSIFLDYNTHNNYIWRTCAFLIISFFQLIVTRGWVRTCEVSARFSLDSLPGKQMAIEAELNSEIITAEEAKIKKDELQKEVDLIGSFDGRSKIFSRIGKIITISLICIMILLLIINGLKIFEIDNKYIIAIIIYGIVSELLLILVPLFTFRIIINNNSKWGTVDTSHGRAAE